MGETMKHITGWLQYTAVYYKWVSRDGVGKDTYETPSDVLCYKAGNTELVRNVNNEEVVSMEQLYIDGDHDVAAGITEDDMFHVNDRDRPVRALGPFYDETGALDYLVVYL